MSEMVHGTLTLTAAPQDLLTALAGANVAANNSARQLKDFACSTIILQPDGANGNECYIGGAGVSTTNFGFRLAAGAAGVPPAPLVLPVGPATARLSGVFAVGTADQKLHFAVVYG